VSSSKLSGDFVVAWTSDAASLADADLPAVAARAFDASGDPMGAVFQINALETGAQAAPALTHVGEDFRAVWETAALDAPFDIATAAFTPAIPPQTFVVTKFADTADGVCDADCSLREAIVAANANTPAADVVQVPAGTYVLTRVGFDDNAFAGDLDITDDLSIVVIPAGELTTATIDANGIDDLFDTDANDTGLVSVEMNDLILTGGFSGGAGGAIDNSGILTMNRCRMTGNESGQNGGALDNLGRATLIDTWVDDNIAGTSGGGISNDGELTLLRTTVSGNTAQNGAGILHLDTSVVLLMYNSTISGNTATVGSGGGMSLRGDAAITNVTIAGNTAAGGASAIAIVGLGTPTITLANTIVEGDCNDDDLISSDGNIESPGTTCFLTTMAGDQLSVAAADLKLAGLTDNGGFTPTRLPLPGSVAIDVAATETACLANDQRGVLRPQDGDAVPEALCDVGAVELAPGEGIEIFADDFETGDTDRWQSLFPPPVR
ncbi:MAG: CSLREA domain-containing protein, partial [Planctomycetes bacterium]|nr:CSLREA domain-containing protein [Planctomycetota bacterium]